MPRPHVVFDIETILDEDAVARAHGFPIGDSDAVAQIIGDNFPKAAFHRVVSIAATTLVYDLQEKEWSVLEMGALHADADNERWLVAEFIKLVECSTPTLVGFNSLGFDLPVIQARAMLHRIRAPHLAAYGFDAYRGHHVDLCDMLAVRGRDRMTLDQAARNFGVGAKAEGMSGTCVADLVRLGEYEAIADYCLTDVVATAGLFLLREAFHGRVDTDGLNKGMNNLLEARAWTMRRRPRTFVQAGSGLTELHPILTGPPA